MAEPAPPVPSAPPAALAGGTAPAPRRRWPLWLLLAAVLTAVPVLATVVVLDRLLVRTTVIGDVRKQPASVKYSDDRTHYAAVLHRRSRVFDRHVRYEVYTGSDPSLRYGYFVRLGFGMPEQRPVIKSVAWDRKGLTVTFASGHALFVPARHYIGGR